MNARPTIDAGRTGHLKLNKISQVLPSLSIDNQTQIARFKTTMSGKTFLITISVAPRNIATKFDSGLKLSQGLGGKLRERGGRGRAVARIRSGQYLFCGVGGDRGGRRHHIIIAP